VTCRAIRADSKTSTPAQQGGRSQPSELLGSCFRESIPQAQVCRGRGGRSRRVEVAAGGRVGMGIALVRAANKNGGPGGVDEM
jgi:hypothetical protein